MKTDRRKNNYRTKKEFNPKDVCPGLKVSVNGDDERAFIRALRTFNKKVQDSGLLREIRAREFYEKPSIVRKRKKDIAVKREARRRESEITKRKRLY
jgi:small subunit ribosomal protein S21